MDKDVIIKSKFLSRRKLYHPLHLYKINSKLKFSLFSACAETKNQGNCKYTEEARYLVRTWVLDEV